MTRKELIDLAAVGNIPAQDFQEIVMDLLKRSLPVTAGLVAEQFRRIEAGEEPA